MDEKHFEHAAFLEQLARDRGLAEAHRRELRSHVHPPDFDGSCPLCGSSIPQARIDAHYYVCVECVSKEEFRRKLGIA